MEINMVSLDAVLDTVGSYPCKTEMNYWKL